MRYLKKTEASAIIANGWRYPTHRKKIRDELLVEQHRFCAYSERYIEETDACEVEHFDPRLKKTDGDNYWNWFSVLRWFNQHKPYDIEEFLPLPKPFDPTLATRIGYEGNLFVAINPTDIEAINLIRFLGWNKPEVVRDRTAHVDRICELQEMLEGEIETLVAYLHKHPQNLSFATALETRLGIKFEEAAH